MLSKRDIEKELGKGINIVPVIRDNFKENSINLTVSENAWTQSSATVYWYGGESFGLKDTSEKKRLDHSVGGQNANFMSAETAEKLISTPFYYLTQPH